MLLLQETHLEEIKHIFNLAKLVQEVGGVVISKAELLDNPGGSSLGSADASGTGQYFVDQTTGQFHFIFITSVFNLII